MNRKDLSEDVYEYAYEWSKLEITDIEVEEAKQRPQYRLCKRC